MKYQCTITAEVEADSPEDAAVIHRCNVTADRPIEVRVTGPTTGAIAVSDFYLVTEWNRAERIA